MKISDRIVIASRLNDSQVRVFIPEKIWIKDRLYVQPYKFFRTATSAPKIHVFGSNEAIFRITTTFDEITITEPFTKQLLDGYMMLCASLVDGSQKSHIFRFDVREQKTSNLKPEHIPEYLKHMTKDSSAWQKYIFLLGDAKPT